MTIQPAGFNLNDLPYETRTLVQERTSQIKGLMRKTAEQVVELGGHLTEVKNVLDHGQFLGWLESEFAWSENTARNFMRVYDRFKSAIIADLYVAPTALYVLAAPSTPVEAVNEALKRAQSGERITVEGAKKIVSSHKPDKPATTPKPKGSSPWDRKAEQLGAVIPEWWTRWNERKTNNPDIVQFVIAGDEQGTNWLAFEADAARVARILNCDVQKFGLPGDVAPLHEVVKLLVPTPKPDWWEGMYQALETKVDSFPDDSQLLWSLVGNLHWSTPIPVTPESGAEAELEPASQPQPASEADTPDWLPDALAGHPVPSVVPPAPLVPFAGPKPGIPANGNGMRTALIPAAAIAIPHNPTIEQAMQVTEQAIAALVEMWFALEEVETDPIRKSEAGAFRSAINVAVGPILSKRIPIERKRLRMLPRYQRLIEQTDDLKVLRRVQDRIDGLKLINFAADAPLADMKNLAQRRHAEIADRKHQEHIAKANTEAA